MRKFAKILATALAIITVSLPATLSANDSEAEFALGGLTLKKSEAVQMDSEDLFISADEVRVKYRFTNSSDKDVTTLVSFPLPPVPQDMEAETLYLPTPDFDTLKFETKVNGKAAPLTPVALAMIGKRDVTQEVAALGWPVNWVGEYGFVAQFDKMSEAERKPLIDKGLIRKVENYDYSWIPAWQATRHITRQQLFPAGKTITVEHSYAPLIGGSVGGALNKSLREQNPSYLRGYQRDYCVDDYFLKGFDRRNALPGRVYTETWLGYILSSGANWKGPIKDFRLVVDKGSTDNLVSFCMTGVKKISPTLFEVRKKDFEPEKDLKILIVQWSDVGE